MTHAKAKDSRSGLSHPLFLLFLFILVAGSAAGVPLLGWQRGILVAFDVASAIFVGSTFFRMRKASYDGLRASAARNDAGRSLLLLTAGITIAVVLVVVGLELGASKKIDVEEVVIVAFTLTLAWFFGNVVYALHYAHMFYDADKDGSDHGGLDFPGDRGPDFLDFVYFAFVLGMTFQVSDVQIESPRIRRVATMHGLVAFFFNIGVVALTVNVVAGAAK